MHFSTTLIALMATTVFALPGQPRAAAADSSWSNVSNDNSKDNQKAPVPTTTAVSGNSWSNVKDDNGKGNQKPPVPTTTAVSNSWSNVKDSNKGDQKPPAPTTTAAAAAGNSWSNVKAVKDTDDKSDQKPPTPTGASGSAPPPPPSGTSKPPPPPSGSAPPPPPSGTTTATVTSDTWSNIATTKGSWSNIAKAQAKSTPSPSPNPIFAPAATSLPAKLGSNPSETCTWEFILTCMSEANTAGSVCLGPLAEASTNCFSTTTCAAKIGNNAAACASCYTSFGKQKFVSACYEAKTDSSVKPVFEKLVSAGVCDGAGKVEKS